MVGVAVGLGNVWRFPYMMGSYGGSAFLFSFLFFVALFAIPAVMAEWTLGRATRLGPIGAFSATLGPRFGRGVGMLLFITIAVAVSYYLLVVAYIVYTGWFCAVRGFDDGQLQAYQNGMSLGWLHYLIALGLLLASLWVLFRGLKKGIEAFSVWIMPMFGLIVLVLIGYTLSMEGALAHLLDFLKPDLGALLKPANIFAAMGQAFFSLSLGGTFFVIYGSYLRQEEKLPGAAILTGLGDAGAALMVSLFIVPAILVFGLELGQGPNLIFDTLPRLFAHMPAGRVVGTLFLVCLTLVAFLSSLAALQVILSSLQDHWRLDMKTALLGLGIGEALLILPTALNPSLIGKLDLVFGSGMQCLGSGLAILAVTLGLGRARALREMFGVERGRWLGLIYFWMRWVIPVGLLITLVMYMIDNVG